MALLFFDGFETYATDDILKDWTAKTGSPTINSSGGRSGGGALYIPINTATEVVKYLPSNYSTLVVGFWFNPTAFEAYSRSIIRLMDGASPQIEIRANSTGYMSVTRNGTSLGVASAPLVVNSDNYVELKVTIHDTTGSFELRLNGVNVVSGSNVDTKNTANAYVNRVALGTDGNTFDATTYKYDDLYVLDSSGSSNNDFLGDVHVVALYPTADGTYTDWTPSSGSDHYALVDESTPNTSDYVSSGTGGEQDSYVMSDPPALGSQIIHGVRVKVAALKDDTGSRSIKVGVRSGTTDSLSASQSLSTSQLYYSQIFEVDPDTTAAWTPEALDDLEALIESV